MGTIHEVIMEVSGIVWTIFCVAREGDACGSIYRITAKLRFCGSEEFQEVEPNAWSSSRLVLLTDYVRVVVSSQTLWIALSKGETITRQVLAHTLIDSRREDVGTHRGNVEQWP